MNSEMAAKLLSELFPEVTGEQQTPSRMALLCTMAIARGESGYGVGWKNEEIVGNWGSVHCPNTGSDCSPNAQKGQTCALASDTQDGKEATRKPQCFKVYNSHREGAADFLRELVVRRKPVRKVLNGGDALTIAHVMRENKYYNKKNPKRHYALMIYLNARAISARMKWPELVALRPCNDCSAGSGEPCAEGCPGEYYDGPPNSGPSPSPWKEPTLGLPQLAPRAYVPPPVRMQPAPDTFDGGGGALLAGAGVAFLLAMAGM